MTGDQDDADPVRPDGGDAATFEEIMEKFADSPSQQAVIRLLLERGFSVNDEGRVVSGGIEIPNTGIAREVGVDRRVVDATTDAILADDDLRRIFQNISAIPSLMDLAPVLDLTVLTVTVTDAEEAGIVAAVTTAIADAGISIRQTISEDPEFTDEPQLYVITDRQLPGELITDIQAMPFVHKLELQ
jgi:predicted regulator of amino acid metabolism with ACT domain